MRRDGESNPNNFAEHRRAMIRLSVEVPALTSAWLLTKETRYAEHARRHLRGWFVDETTRMNPNLQFAQAWTALLQSPLFGITLTLSASQSARTLWKRTRGHSLANPVLVATILVAAFLLLFQIPFADYENGAQYISFLLGPAPSPLLFLFFDRPRTSGRQPGPSLPA